MTNRLRSLFSRPALLLATLTGFVAAPAARAQSTAPTPYPAISQLVNLSVRSKLTSGQNLVVGFVITGKSDTSIRVLVRGVGPGLAGLGVTDAMANPKIVLSAVTPTGSTSIPVDDWSSPPRPLVSVDGITQQPIEQWFNAFPLANGSKDAALLAELKPGNYTVTLSGVTAADVGTTLVEIYNVEVRDPYGAARLSNLSVLGYTSPEAPLTAGFVFQGFSWHSMLVRAVGPGLSGFGVAGAVADPKLEVVNDHGVVTLGNDNWEADRSGLFSSSADVRLAGLKTGAFPLIVGSKDAALTMPLVPGTADPERPHVVRGVGANGTSGQILLEMYEYDVYTILNR